MLGGNYATGEKPERWDIVSAYCTVANSLVVGTPKRGAGILCRDLPLFPGSVPWSTLPSGIHLVERPGFWKRWRLKRWHRRTS